MPAPSASRGGASGRRACWFAVAAVTVLGATACGTRVGYDRLLAAARPSPVVVSQAEPVTGAAVPASSGPSTASAATAAAPAPAPAGAALVPATGGKVTTGATVTQAAGPAAPTDRASTSSSARAGAAAATAACTQMGSPVNVASVGETSGLVGGLVVNQIKALQAWVAMQNDHGGIACHPIHLIVADDGGDPSRNQALVQQMVEQNHVVAFLNNTAALTGNASASYITQHQIPAIGDEGGEPWFYDSPYFFPQISSGSYLVEGAIAALARTGEAKGFTKLASFSCVEASVCQANPTVTKDAGRFGYQVVYAGSGSLAQPDFTSECQQAQRAGAEMVLVALDGNSLQRVLRDCNSIGFRPMFGSIEQATTPDIANDPLAEGVVLGTPTATTVGPQTPALLEYEQALATYAPGMAYDYTGLTGWMSGKLFQAAILHVTDPPTPAKIADALYQISNDDLGGMTGSLTFIRAHNATPFVCYWVIQVHGGQFVSPNGGARTCA